MPLRLIPLFRQVDLNNVPNDWEESVVAKIGLLKRHCFAAVFERYFEFQVGGSVFEEGGEERTNYFFHYKNRAELCCSH